MTDSAQQRVESMAKWIKTPRGKRGKMYVRHAAGIFVLLVRRKDIQSHRFLIVFDDATAAAADAKGRGGQSLSADIQSGSDYTFLRSEFSKSKNVTILRTTKDNLLDRVIHVLNTSPLPIHVIVFMYSLGNTCKVIAVDSYPVDVPVDHVTMYIKSQRQIKTGI